MYNSPYWLGFVFVQFSSQKYSGSAEILSAGAGSDEGKQLSEVYSLLLGIDIDFTLVADSQLLWDSISTCHLSLVTNRQTKHIRPHVALPRYDFERKLIRSIVWTSETTNWNFEDHAFWRQFECLFDERFCEISRKIIGMIFSKKEAKKRKGRGCE